MCTRGNGYHIQQQGTVRYLTSPHLFASRVADVLVLYLLLRLATDVLMALLPMKSLTLRIAVRRLMTARALPQHGTGSPAPRAEEYLPARKLDFRFTGMEHIVDAVKALGLKLVLLLEAVRPEMKLFGPATLCLDK